MRIMIVAAALVALTACSGGGGDGGGDGGEPGVSLTASQIVDKLAAAGMPVEDVTVYNARTDPNEMLGRPGQYTSKAGFSDKRIGPDEWGDEPDPTEDLVLDVEAFDSTDDRDQRADYLEGFADSSGLIGGWYQYVEGNAILRVTFDMPPGQAEQYEAAFADIFRGQS